jgi:hypothetical protein
VAWRGSARAATTAPSQGKARPTRRQDTAPHQQQISPRGKVEHLEKKLEVAMAETLGARGDGAESMRRQSTRSHEQVGAPSRDLSKVPHLDG